MRPLLRAMGWTPGLALRVDVVHGAVPINPAADGEHVVGAREELPLPAAARHLCGIASGQPTAQAPPPPPTSKPICMTWLARSRR